MRALLITLAVTAVICWPAQSTWAQRYRDTTGDMINPEKAINNSPTNAHIQLGQEYFGPYRSYRAGSYYAPRTAIPPAVNSASPRQPVNANAQAAQQNRGEQWRYRRHNGQWWYYQTNDKWVVWNGSRWTEPVAHAGSGPNTTIAHP